MSFLIAILVLFAVAIVPIMIGARIVGARNTGVGAALLSVLLLTAISVACGRYVGNELLAFLISAIVGGLLMSVILGTTFWRALGVSVIAAAIQVAVVLLFAGAFLMGA